MPHALREVLEYTPRTLPVGVHATPGHCLPTTYCASLRCSFVLSLPPPIRTRAQGRPVCPFSPALSQTRAAATCTPVARPPHVRRRGTSCPETCHAGHRGPLGTIPRAGELSQMGGEVLLPDHTGPEACTPQRGGASLRQSQQLPPQLSWGAGVAQASKVLIRPAHTSWCRPIR